MAEPYKTNIFDPAGMAEHKKSEEERYAKLALWNQQAQQRSMDDLISGYQRDLGQYKDILPQYQQNAQGFFNSLQGLQGMANQEGPTQYGQFQLSQNQLAQQEQQQQAQQQQAGQMATAQSNLGMFGGLRGGAGERLQQQGARQGAILSQDINRQAQQRRFDILGRDAQFKQGLQTQIPQFQLNQMGQFGNMLAGQQNAATQQANQQAQFKLQTNPQYQAYINQQTQGQ